MRISISFEMDTEELEKGDLIHILLKLEKLIKRNVKAIVPGSMKWKQSKQEN